MAQARRFPAMWRGLQMVRSMIDMNLHGSDEEIFEHFCGAGAAAGATARAKFLEEVRLDPPRFLRVIDCEVSVREQVVVIIDFPIKDVQASGSSGSAICTPIEGYTAISHTYGQPVYEAFNCSCAADCRALVARADPAKSPCNHDHVQKRVIGDVLGMCGLLVGAGVRYAWHDGVCIAQHDEKEVEHFIQHIAWIYANADDTVIFLHYIGRPMAPIAPPSYPDGLISRWQTRVWTFQEAALSKRRRYCVRKGVTLKDAGLVDFAEKLASWYEPNGPNSTEILDEPEFFMLLVDMGGIFNQDMTPGRVQEWVNCVVGWMHLVWSLHCSFPTLTHALDNCSSRESKHEGDRINSILGLARVTGFSVHKDDKVEESTMEFFKRMGKVGLAIALFTTNMFEAINARPHTWYPTLCSPLQFTPSHFRPSGPNFHTDHLEFMVRPEDGSLEVRGLLVCVSLHLTLVKDGGEEIYNAGAMTDQCLSVFADAQDFVFTLEGLCQVWFAKNDLMSDRVLLGGALLGQNETFSSRLMDVLEDVISCGFIQGIRLHVEDFLQDQDHFQDAVQKFGAFNLIFPAGLLDELDDDEEDEEELDKSEPEYLWKCTHSFAAVMVRGDVLSSKLGGGVEKVGCFIASPMLRDIIVHDILQENTHYLTFLDQLVVI